MQKRVNFSKTKPKLVVLPSNTQHLVNRVKYMLCLSGNSTYFTLFYEKGQK